MKIEIDKEDLIRLVKGCDPLMCDYKDNVMHHPLIEPHGSYCGGFVGEWTWKFSDDDKVSELDLIEMYRILTGKVLV